MAPKKPESSFEVHDDSELQEYIRQLVTSIGEDPKREGLAKTPERFVRAFRFLTQGYKVDPKAVITQAMFEAPYSEMVIVRNIEVYSLCEHHLLPFFGKCHVGYLPNGKIVGLSKIPRIVDTFARRLQVQERLTTQIAECLMEHVAPHGVGVVIEAFHLCMMMRGVEKQNNSAQTSCLLGEFKRKPETRSEFFNLIK